nr:dihydropteroate synthase [Aquicoccus sp. G2-2]MEA1113648.1 dihydropteroate synthase [Aquicoccus sp. G2-2]
MTVNYYRPLVQSGQCRPDGALCLAGGPLWFTHAEEITRERARVIAAGEIPANMRARLTAPRAAVAGLSLEMPRIMGILNVTPDSFSDGGSHVGIATARADALQMVVDGADIIDIGGESTRPGAAPVPDAVEIARTEPVIAALKGAITVPISIDTRKASVARPAVEAGAAIVNDVSGLTHDAALAQFCAEAALPVCVMHAQGDPRTMQDDPQYENVLLDVYDFLAAQISLLERQGIPRERIIVDPGIGFGKTMAHNLALLNGLSLFHGLGCALLLGASRKGFIGRLSNAPDPQARAPGSIAVGLAALAQGVHILRVHDVKETRQALALWNAVRQG